MFFIPWPLVNFHINRGDFLLKIRGGPWGGPWTGSMGWSMDPGPCFVYVPIFNLKIKLNEWDFLLKTEMSKQQWRFFSKQWNFEAIHALFRHWRDLVFLGFSWTNKSHVTGTTNTFGVFGDDLVCQCGTWGHSWHKLFELICSIFLFYL